MRGGRPRGGGARRDGDGDRRGRRHRARASPPTPATKRTSRATSRCALETFGGLDVVYANAGISGGLTPLFEQTVEHWPEVLRVNLIGPFLAIKHAAPVMIARGRGSIV